MVEKAARQGLLVCRMKNTLSGGTLFLGGTSKKNPKILPNQTSNRMIQIDPDKWLHRSPQFKIKLFTVGCAVLTLVWAIQSTAWALVLSALLSVLIARVAVEIGFHRYFTHRSFSTPKWKERLLLLLGSTMSVGSCLFWVSVHRAHHAFSDTPKDPHSPHYNGVIRTFFSVVCIDDNIERKYIKDLITDPWQRFIHHNYYKLLIGWIVLLAVLSWSMGSLALIATAYAMPVVAVLIFSGITNVFSHWVGYRSFDVNDRSHNNHWLRPLSLLLTSSAASLHNNHHKYPNAWDLNVNNEWFEFDLDAWIIKHLLRE
jgi:fatty-acid desaturase